jgi:hypothetical protein
MNSWSDILIEIDWKPGENNLVLDSSAGSGNGGSIPNAINYIDPMVSYTSTPTPIPPAFLLFGSGLLGLAGFRKKIKE